MNVTKEEYLSALEIVEKYHEQILKDKRAIEDVDKTLVIDWLETVNASVRLVNALTKGKPKPFEYIEDINAEKFLKVKRVGKNTLEELEDLLNRKI
jgi:DNA-directed RNA polymerase alpha subunit